MPIIKDIQKLHKIVENKPHEYQAVEDLFELVRIYEQEDNKQAHVINKDIRKITAKQVGIAGDTTVGEQFYVLNKRCLRFDAETDLDAYLQYIEFDRLPAKKFYVPRRKIIKPIVDALQQVENDELDLLSVSMPPGTGKTSLGLFFLTWIIGKYPEKPCLASAHSDSLTRSFYDGVLNIITDSEYLWADVFPAIKYIKTNAKDETIDLKRAKRFKTLTCRSIDGSLTGPTRCESVLYIDDLVSGIEEALSKSRMDTLWSKYTSDLNTRKKQYCKEIHIATRWSVHDPIGRLQTQHENDPRAKFLAFPALDDNDKSNFNYEYSVGFNSKHFYDIRDIIDDVSWKCLFMNEPVEREGLLFPENELMYYNGILPEGEPDRKVSVCDIAWGGGNNLSMPICYVYGKEAYVVDVVFSNGDKDNTRPLVVGKLKHHLPHQNRFEANNGGDEYADKVDELLRADGVKLNISHRRAPSTASKLSRIIQASPDIKRLFFLDPRHRTQEYTRFMREVTSFMQTGKNKLDDAADSLAMLTVLLDNPGGTIEIIKRPF